ncbi:DUF551 domain-containing protein [Cronobacter sakazakii]|nr:DUF551 domain-containing protein [Cronobacter sakazakii]
MSTISNERLEEYANQERDLVNKLFMHEDTRLMATELLALRKERERAEPVYYGPYTPVMMGAGVWVSIADELPPHLEGREVWVTTAPPAPVVGDDSLPFDPQIAEYEQVMEAEQAQADATPQQFESLAGKAVVPAGWKLVPIELTKEMRGKIHPFAEATCLNCGRQVVADCEDNVTASWNDMLAVAPAPVGKQSSTAEGNNDGFECTPVADLYELLTKCGECYDYTTSAKVASDWIKEGYSAREYVKLDRLQEAMTHGSSGEPDGWIPCSERMPDTYVNVLLTDEHGDTCIGQLESFEDAHFYISSSIHRYKATHWQPLPEPPCK